MQAFVHAVTVFWDHLSAVRWDSLGIALACQLAKLVVRGFAWRNILAASYPGARILRRSIFGAYVAGVGVNAIAPARAGNLVELYLTKRRVPGSTYPTLAGTLVVETLFDFVVAGAIFCWALAVGVIPSRAVIERLPSVDLGWPLQHPGVSLIVLGVLAAVLVALALWARRRLRELRAQVGRGFAILGDRSDYLRLVASWQALSWVFRLATVYFFLRAFGLTPNVHNALVVQTVDSLSTLMPFTPGGAGTKQGLLAYAFRSQFPVGAVLSFSVGMNIALVAANVLLGFGALLAMTGTLRWRRLANAQKRESNDTAHA